jgi:hypothetical protein
MWGKRMDTGRSLTGAVYCVSGRCARLLSRGSIHKMGMNSCECEAVRGACLPSSLASGICPFNYIDTRFEKGYRLSSNRFSFQSWIHALFKAKKKKKT